MASSPAREASASPVPGFISPRSKVAQMLADIDNALTPSPTKAKPIHLSPASATISAVGYHGDSHTASPMGRTGSGSEDESDASIRKPTGRLARRMRESHQRQRQTSHSRRMDAISTIPTRNDEDDLYSVTPEKQHRNARPQPPSRSASMDGPSLFVSPNKSIMDDSDDDLPANPLLGNSKLAALVAQKQAEREARELDVAARREQRSDSPSSDLPDGDMDELDDDTNLEVDRKMPDAAKPTRKASKKALLEMERETQRIARQQALAHQMKVKKKFTTTDLLSRFNFRPAGDVSSGTDDHTALSSALDSESAEGFGREPVSTPPSSPPTPLDRQRALVEMGALSKLVPVRQDSLVSLASMDDDEDLPDLAELLSSARTSVPAASAFGADKSLAKPDLKLSRLGKLAMKAIKDDSSEDELEIIQPLPSHLRVFDKVKGSASHPHVESAAIHTLKHLSRIGADSAQLSRGKLATGRPSINPQVLEAQLRSRAKEQARAQQLERIAELKAKGIDVQTTEEREREAEDFENLLDKARQEAVDLRKAEKAASRGKTDGEDNALVSEDESEDEDYIDGPGSEDEIADEDERENHEMVDDAAEDMEDEEKDSEDEEDEVRDEEDPLVDGQRTGSGNLQVEELSATPGEPNVAETPVHTRRPRKSRLIVDDDDGTYDEVSRDDPDRSNENEADEEEANPFAAFNFGAGKPAGSLMSPTQAFNATMQTPTQATQQDSMDILQQLAPPTSSIFAPVTPRLGSQSQMEESQTDFVPGSQVAASQQINLAWDTQSPETPLAGLRRDESTLTLETPGWQPTQDDGLPPSWQARHQLAREDTIDPLVDDDTQSTVPLRISESPAPAATASRRRHRLKRGHRAAVESSDDEDVVDKPAEAPKQDAFREMARKRKEVMTVAERTDADHETKRMMDDQAEESEDEYAGLGGDDFVAPETEEDREMIDSSHVEVDERALAAHFAEKQRLAEEAAASKLYKDLTTGALRRKQANMFDLDDDEDDLAARRRQMRQLEEARKRKLLLQDDNIAGLAEGKPSKGKDAFLKAIADDDNGDDDILDLSDDEEEDNTVNTQTDSQLSERAEPHTQPLREISGNKRQFETAPEGRPPAKLRRTQASAFRAPTSLLQVKESVSFLLDEPHHIPAGPAIQELNSDSENEPEDQETEEVGPDMDEDDLQSEMERQNDGGFAPDRKIMPPPRLPALQRRTAAKPAVVDRLSLKRVSSASDSAAGPTAWAASATGGFKIPSLLRRATTNTAMNVNERGVSTSNGLSREDSGVKMGGTKKSSLAYQARAEERKVVVEASARRRAENTARIASLRRGSSGLGQGLLGRFE